MLIFGVVASILWLSGLACLVYLNLDKALDLELNALGDFLAGGFAPLAFLWLVIGYFQQGKELKLNRDALLLQAEELKRSVEQQENLVAITREEINLIKEDRRIKYEADKFKARPIIVAGRISFYPIVRGSGCQVYLSNNGGAISNVRIFLGSQYGEGEAFCVVGNNEWGYWDCGTEKVISFSSVGKYIFRLPSMFKVVLEYKDMLSDEGRCVLVFNYNEDKGLNVAMAEEVLKIFDESVDEILVRR